MASFDRAAGTSANQALNGLSIRAVDGRAATIDAAQRVVRRCDERGCSDVLETFAVARPGAAAASDGPRPRPPLSIDFAVARRAVLLELAVAFDEGNQPMGSDGRPGIDRQAVVLTAFDQLGAPIGSTTLELSGSGNVTAERGDLLLGFRDAGGAHPPRRSAADAGERRRQHARGARPAAMRQGEVSPGQPVNLILPFGLDRAMVLTRGLRCDLGERPRAIERIASDVHVTLLPGRLAVIGASGAVHAEDGRREEELAVYYTLLAWDSRQIEAATATGSIATSGKQQQTATGRLPDASGCPIGCNLDAAVLLTALSTHYQNGPEDIEDWAVSVEPVGVRYPDRTVEAEVWNGFDDAADVTLTLRTLTGESVVAHEGLESSVGFTPDDDPIRDDPERFDYATFEMADLGFAGELEADMVAVGARNLVLDLDDEPIRRLDLEVRGAGYDGTHADVMAGGGGRRPGAQHRHRRRDAHRRAGVG